MITIWIEDYDKINRKILRNEEIINVLFSYKGEKEITNYYVLQKLELSKKEITRRFVKHLTMRKIEDKLLEDKYNAEVVNELFNLYLEDVFEILIDDYKEGISKCKNIQELRAKANKLAVIRIEIMMGIWNYE